MPVQALALPLCPIDSICCKGSCWQLPTVNLWGVHINTIFQIVFVFHKEQTMFVTSYWTQVIFQKPVLM